MYSSSFYFFFRYRSTCSTSVWSISPGQPPSVWLIPRGPEVTLNVFAWF